MSSSASPPFRKDGEGANQATPAAQQLEHTEELAPEAQQDHVLTTPASESTHTSSIDRAEGGDVPAWLPGQIGSHPNSRPTSRPNTASAINSRSNSRPSSLRGNFKPFHRPDTEEKLKKQRVDDVISTFVDEGGQFHLEGFAKSMHQLVQQQSIPVRQLGVSWRNLSVYGTGSGYATQTTAGGFLTHPINPIKSIQAALHPPVNTILDSVSGTIRPGQMLLLLGRPGAGCTTMLKILASYRDGYHSVDGDIIYDNLSHDDIQGQGRGEVVFAPEDDVHFPTLTVQQTFEFAVAARTPQEGTRVALQDATVSGDAESVAEVGGKQYIQSRNEHAGMMVEVLGNVLGLKGVFDTKVGNDVVRGISGGQRKRVTVGEAMASQAPMALYDNSSRGLDSSTALEFVRALRVGANVYRTSVAASLYQASDNMVQLFDNVMVLNKGRQVYFGPLTEAVSYFERLGFKRQDRQTIADFLVACASGEMIAVAAPHVGEGPHRPPPISPDDQKAAWTSSAESHRLQQLLEPDFYSASTTKAGTSMSRAEYMQTVRASKATTSRKGSRYTISTPMQVALAIRRRTQIVKGDLKSELIPATAGIFQALIVGSVFVRMPNDTDNLFSRGGVIFFALLYFALSAMAEIPRAYAQRPIVIRHKKFAFIHPSADAIADSLLSIPITLINLIPFSVLVYFMTGLAATADQFFIFFFTTALTSFLMVAFFRMLAALCRDASRASMFAGIAILDVLLYAGYMIARPSMRIWWKWLSYCNPLAYSFEILLSNEFRRLESKCVTFVPSGSWYDDVSAANKVCAVAGAQPGQLTIDGAAYLDATYGYKFSNAPRNAGILIAMWIFFLFVYMVATECQKDPSTSGGVLLFKEGTKFSANTLEQKSGTGDPEKATVAETPEISPDSTMSGATASARVMSRTSMPVQSSVFNWRNVNYTVDLKGGETRRLLHDVSGYVEPGKLTALMGESGAGKTTLLNVLAQRVDAGVVTGQFLVDGAPIKRSFQANTGYCQQQDIHLDTQTIREALQFSALLRQPRHVPREEKLAYVKEVLDMLELTPYADAVIGQPGQGLNLEQRKMVTVGVELAARPQLLIFLDEPTSGLDSIAAWSIIRLLRKLANAGQAILCTIHQPSGELFNQFDRLLLLRKGGETVFFGETGEGSAKLIKYFEQTSGQLCAPHANPAEYVLDVIGAGATATTSVDWYGAFLQSHLKTELDAKLAELYDHTHENALLAGSNHDDHDQDQTTEYAASFGVQFVETLKRISSHYYRSSMYIASKLMLNVISGLFVGSTYWGRGSDDSLASGSNKIFACFMALVMAPSIGQQMQPTFIALRTLYEARERPSKMYSWPVAVLVLMLVEIPWNLLGGSLFFLPWYLMTDFPRGKAAGIVWGFYMLFQLFFGSLAQAMAALAPNASIASLLFSVLFSFVITFCGVLQPKSAMPTFWSSWMFYLTPFTYFMEGMLSHLLGGKKVRCLPSEFNTVVPPNGQMCDAYLGPFAPSLSSVEAAFASNTIDKLGGKGYFAQNDDSTCSYCAYRTGDERLKVLSYDAGNWKRDFAIVCGFVVFNYGICLGTFYLFRIAQFKKPQFGVGGAEKKKKTKVDEGAEMVQQQSA